MKKIFITATNTDIGKTYTTCKLLEKYAKQGYRVGAIKPIETGVEKTPQDGEKLLDVCQQYNKEFANLTPKDITPITLALAAAPFVANNLKPLALHTVYATIKQLESMCDILFIEGAGGLMVPIDTNYFMLDFIKDLHVDNTCLITHCDLGCINDTLLSLKLLEQNNLPHTLLFNCKNGTKNFELVSKPYFQKVGIEVNVV